MQHLTLMEEIDQLSQALRLPRVRQVVVRELERAAMDGIAASEVVARLLREEWQDRQARSLTYQLKQASAPVAWEIDTYPFARQPGVRAQQIRELTALDFVARGINVVFIGKPGVGKSGLATGLLLRAVRSGRRGLFIKAQDLMDDLYASLADRTTKQLLKRLTRLDVLVIDELSYVTLRPEQANGFFKLIDKRHEDSKSTIVTTHLDYDRWPGLLGNADMTAALLDRLRQRCVTIRIDGPSLRAATAG